MTGSRDLPPLIVPFFSGIFIKNQFRTKVRSPPKGTSLSGQVAIVTGSNTGLGFESARQFLAIELSHLILAVRSISKGKEAAQKLHASYPNAKIQVWELEMSSYNSIQAFVRRAETELPRLNIVVLNAGLGRLKFGTVSSTGHEEIIQVNHLSTALLMILMLPVLKAKSLEGRPGRLTIINSVMAYTAKFNNKNETPLLPSLDDPKMFNPGEYYGISKLLGQIILWKLVDYVSSADVIVNMVDPGWIRGTGLARDLPAPIAVILKGVMAVSAKSVFDGAAAYIDAAVMRGSESHGCFIMGWEIQPFAPVLYTPEGKPLVEKVWRETMEELSFAKPVATLESMKSN